LQRAVGFYVRQVYFVAHAESKWFHLNGAALLQNRVKQWNELRRQRHLAVHWPPTRRERKHVSFPDHELEHGGIIILEPRQDSTVWRGLDCHMASFPEMDFGEIAETRISEWREKRVREIDFTEHR